MIIVRRYCIGCRKVTKWTIKAIGKFWEKHTCEECGESHEIKTR